ncbi:MAG: DNA topoisomerase III [Firmicutes bacterium]|nr:DNA topoisomerase III [Bacillota bacterium]
MKPVIIAEKASVARDIARALGGFVKQAGYMESPEYILTAASGHLVTLKEPEDYDARWKRWSLKTLPIVPPEFGLKTIPRQRRQFELIKRLLRGATLAINACDAGREGELIFRQICELAGYQGPVKRLWISSLTTSAIRQGFADLQPGERYDNLAAAARCRSQGDWLMGINATRAYTGRQKTLLSVGRVQTPTLALLVSREQEIRAFVPEDFWVVKATFSAEAGEYQGRWFNKEGHRIWQEEQAEAIVRKVAGKPGRIAELEHKERRENPPLLYDLTSLQREANKRFGYSASRTLAAAQALYEKHKLITYPRTNSRFLSPDLIPSFPRRLQAISVGQYAELVQPLLPKPPRLSGRVINPAKVTDHHAIIPTEKKAGARLASEVARVYDLIVRRFISVFYPPCLWQETRVITQVEAESFETKGKELVQAGWRTVEGASGEQLLPPLFPELAVQVKDVIIGADQTKPPARYTEGSLLAAMEGAGTLVDDDELREAMKEGGLGTPATRAAIIERLKNVEYVRAEGKALLPTEKGEQLIGLLATPELLSPELTGHWEKRLAAMERGEEDPAQFMDAVTKLATTAVEAALTVPRAEIASAGSAREPIGTCPLCGGEVAENRKAFGCRNWKPEAGGCKFVIWKRIAGKNLSANQARELLNKGRTRELKGFTSKAGKKFAARLVLKDNRVEFDFPARKGK